MNRGAQQENLNEGAPAAVLTEVQATIGRITLNRPQALNALSLEMVREITRALQAWRDDPRVSAVVWQGAGQQGRAPAFCAGGDIRFFHAAALAGDPRIDDFFTEEYQLNHLIHTHPKPGVALMDGVVMGGGMGLGQGASLRVVTERTKMAMPETHIGLFPDVGGGYFLSRCPGRWGECLALTGQVIGAADAIALGLADVFIPSGRLPALQAALVSQTAVTPESLTAVVQAHAEPVGDAPCLAHQARVDRHFGQANLAAIVASLQADPDPWAAATHQTLMTRSPLMMAVALAQLRRGRCLSLADDLRMERNLVHHCLHLRPGAASETVEGIRALVIDKDHTPRWNPARVEDVTPAMVAAFFEPPWPPHAHPLRHL